MTTALSKALFAAPLLSLALLAPPAVAQAAPDAEPSADQNLDNAESPFLVMPNAVQMNKIITTAVQDVVQGKKTAKVALDEAAAEWNKIFAAAK